MDLKKITSLLQTSKPQTVFEKIIAFNELADNSTNRVTVRVGLSSGFVLEGVPLKMDSEGNAVFTSTNNSISYVDISSLVGIEIINPEGILDILTAGSYFEVPQNAVPTTLQLKRIFKSQSDILESNYGLKMYSEFLENAEITAAEKYQFEKFLNVLQEALGEIATDSLGEKALSELEELKVYSDDKNLVLEKNNKNLQVGVNFKNKFTTDFKAQLKVAFESNL